MNDLSPADRLRPIAATQTSLAWAKTTTDRSAIEAWLGSYSRRSEHTVRSFRKEAERFLMWLEATKGDSGTLLPKTSIDDVNKYLDYLGGPGHFPPALLARFGRTEQPFKGPLSPSSIRQTITILHGLFDALRNLETEDGQSYIRINPWVLARRGATKKDHVEVEQALSSDEWAEVVKTIEALPKRTQRQRTHYARCRWLFQLLYRAFLRREEAAKLSMKDFENSPDGWSLRFIGKGAKAARIVVSKALLYELITYRQSCGLPPLPSPGEDRPAIFSVIGKEKPISDQSIYAICTSIFRETADRIESERPASAARLRLASPHWLRHTGISHALEHGVDPRYVQSQARHSSLNVTAVYDHKDRKRWREQMELL